jgi:fibronectin-binding autotransporter adhesin
LKKILMSLGLAATLSVFSGTVLAHTVALGYVPGATLGEVTFWVGNYTHAGTPGNVPNEGSLQLSGQNGTVYGPTTSLFDLNTLSKPSGLTDGVNYFYASGTDGVAGNPLVNTFAESYITSCPACGPVTGWQGVSVSGLTAGDYKFEFIEQLIPTFDWTEWNDSLNSTFTLRAGDIGGGVSAVPLPAALPLYGAGLALMGFVGWRKRRKSA